MNVILEPFVCLGMYCLHVKLSKQLDIPRRAYQYGFIKIG